MSRFQLCPAACIQGAAEFTICLCMLSGNYISLARAGTRGMSNVLSFLLKVISIFSVHLELHVIISYKCERDTLMYMCLHTHMQPKRDGGGGRKSPELLGCPNSWVIHPIHTIPLAPCPIRSLSHNSIIAASLLLPCYLLKSESQVVIINNFLAVA